MAGFDFFAEVAPKGNLCYLSSENKEKI